MNNETIYDYIITLPNTPAFKDNIALMTETIISSGGTSPTIIVNTARPMYGTKAANGKIQLHFRLREKLSETSLITFLEQGMVNPKPPITVCSIRSAFKIEGQYAVIMQANKATFLPYMNDVFDHMDETDPENPRPVYRPPNMSDQLFLSAYHGTEHIELI